MAKAPPKAQPADNAQLLAAARAAAEANRTDAQAQTEFGWALYGAGQPAEAAEQFKKALTIDMNFLDAHYGLGLASKALNIKDGAISAFEKAASLATQLDDRVKAGMLSRLAHGQINEIRSGDWQLAEEIWHREP